MSYYVLVDLDIRDAARFKEYQLSVRPMIEAAGGEYLVRGGEQTIYDGDLRLHRLVIFRWPNKAAHDEFYNSSEYQPLKALRLATTVSSIVGVEGYEASPA